MLQLKRICKLYGEGDNVVSALKGIDLDFRPSEFVSILGPSGCGKTTLLNIIGGLDRYTEGDLLIGGKSTKDFRAADWDAYRNHSIGFVFQSYNLIPHLTVLGNVELALTLSGVSPAERRRRAAEALAEVGLKSQLNKRPNQLSGGQMQRVAIARAIVNNPEILLADEPTGALDSTTSLQIMELLKKISDKRLIIMVTHNGELAERYSTRIIRLLDGEIVDDTDPFDADAEATAEPREVTLAGALDRGEARERRKREKAERKKTSMSFLTALNLSLRNLVTKKGRTFMTSFAGSIGIIGVALVLAISNGFSGYIARLQSDTLAGYPVTVNRTATAADVQYLMQNSPDYVEFPEENVLFPYNDNMMEMLGKHTNVITQDYIDYVGRIDKSLTTSVAYAKSIRMHVLKQTGENQYAYLPTGTSYNSITGSSSSVWQEMFDEDLIESQFDVLEGGRLPEKKEEVVLIVDKYNRIPQSFLKTLGVTFEEGKTLRFEDFVGMEFKLVLNDAYYVFKPGEGASGEYQVNRSFKEVYHSESEDVIGLSVVGILRQKPDSQSVVLSSGFAHTQELTDFVLADAKISDAAKAQAAAGKDNIVVEDEKSYEYALVLQHLGLDETPASIRIYPKDFDAKQRIREYLDAWNVGKEDADQILYSDLAEIMTSSMGTMVNIISYVLIAFAAISLVVSSIMIGIITYTSVIERTKEIGVLRSIGARKKDISRVFNAETLIIGFCAGIIGVAVSALLTIPINLIIYSLSEINGIAALNPLHGLLLVAISMVLTLIAGLVPARIAAKKDPVVALRTE